MDAHLIVERKDGVLSIMLARPERRNAITVAMYSALADAIESAADNRAIRLITIEGQGEDFTAGNDFGDFLQALGAAERVRDFLQPRPRRLRVERLITIRAEHGRELGRIDPAQEQIAVGDGQRDAGAVAGGPRSGACRFRTDTEAHAVEPADRPAAGSDGVDLHRSAP